MSSSSKAGAISTMDSTLLDTAASFSSPPFSTLLDARILRALADQGFTHPTLVQAEAVPRVLEGRDVLARARTGSGKTGGYAMPAVQGVLNRRKEKPLAEHARAVSVLILVPTRELAQQVTTFTRSLTRYCEGEDEIKVVNGAAGSLASLGASGLHDIPDILVITPSRCLNLLQSKTLTLPSLSLLIIDEADLILSYGHSADLQRLLDPSQAFIPRVGVQGVLMSATLGTSNEDGGAAADVEKLKGLVLRNPAILTLQEPEAARSLLKHYSLTTSETDKFLLMYVLLKLKLIRGKILVFVNTIDRGYRVKLFLEQFGLGGCLLNSEMPLNSRYHIVEEFNRGKYDYIVATDEADPGVQEREEAQEQQASGSSEATLIPSGAAARGQGEQDQAAGTVEGEDDEGDEQDADSPTESETLVQSGKSAMKRKATSNPAPKSKKPRRQDKTFGVSRGIDFVSVSCVVNFDLPTTVNSYVHRVGRTARAGQTGLALSFVVPKAKWGKDKGISLETARKDEKVFERIRAHVKEEFGSEIKEWDWGGRKGEIEAFRYRMEDALRAVTGKRVMEARREELRRELLNSDKLKAHFAANPLDFSFVRHDVPLHPTRIQPHMKHVPQYLMPKIAQVPLSKDDGEEAHVPFANRGRGGGRGGRGRGRGGARGGRGGKKSNPLKKF